MIRREDIPDFVVGAVCGQTDPEAFHPAKGEPTAPARKVCAGCDVVDECREYALARPELDGVWGATTKRERVLIRARRQAGAA